jgi:hypothetical protein
MLSANCLSLQANLLNETLVVVNDINNIQALYV